MPAEHLARFIAELVDEHVDLVRLRAAYTEGRGAPPDDPRLMVRILLYGYITGVRSSRVIERKCVDDVAFRWLAAGSAPDYRAIARFHKRHLSALGHLFVEALALCQTAGMVRLGQVALDGTSARDNAAKRKAMSDARRSEKRVRQRAAPKRTAQRALVGAFLLALTFAGGYVVAVHKTVTLSVDGFTDDGVDYEVAGDRRGEGQRLRRR